MEALKQVYRANVVNSDARKRTIRELKNKVYNYTETEQMVREATCNHPNDPQPELMREIAKGTFTVDFSSIMNIIWKRLKDRSNEHHPRKCLILLDFLLQQGNNEMVHTQVRNNLHLIRALTSWHFYNDQNTDVATPVRHAAHKFLQVLFRNTPRRPLTQTNPPPCSWPPFLTRRTLRLPFH